ncbi:uncharacterized protein [Lolium perenne]|uniref:uncharacterized protein isoform X2 n=1 Tax=Lolium perenne TaxID=4522 RepID=UPI003A9A19E4
MAAPSFPSDLLPGRWVSSASHRARPDDEIALSLRYEAMQLDDSDGALDCWAGFYALTGELVGGAGDLSVCSCLATVVADLYARGLATLVRDYFLRNLEMEGDAREPCFKK